QSRARAEENTVTDKKKIVLKDEKARGAALEVLGEIAETVNVTLADELEGDAWASPIVEAIGALKNAAKVEQITEGTELAERAEGDKPEEEETASRAVEGLEGAAL